MRRKTQERHGERISIGLPILVHLASRPNSFVDRSKTVDLSRSGLSFRSVRAYRYGVSLEITFKSAVARETTISARVVRVRSVSKSRSLVAVHFTSATGAAAAVAELLRAQTRLSGALLEIADQLSSKAELTNIIRNISQVTSRILRAEKTYVYLPDGEGGFSAPLGRLRRPLRICRGKGLLGKCAYRGRLTSIQSPSEHDLFDASVDIPFTKLTRSALVVPLIRDEAIEGILLVVDRWHESFTSEDEALARAIAGQLSVLLREATLIEGIRKLQSFNEQILSTMTSGIVTCDQNAVVTYANAAAAKMLGFRAGGNIGTSISQILDLPSNRAWFEALESVLQTGASRTSYDVSLLRRDNQRCSINLTAVPISSQAAAPGGVLLVADDITKEQRLLNTLSRYLAREVAERMLHDKEFDRLGGTTTEVTVLIADIRNFTALTQQMSPGDLMALLNAYFPPMINVIFRHHGMVDKFMGDAILAVFGVPSPAPDDSLRAVRAAIGMRQELFNVNQNLKSSHAVSIEIGIGITNGTVIAGNIGSERRMDFTVIGEPVNLASRLEGLTKDLQRRILISEGVYNSVRDAVACESLGLLRIRGREDKMPVYAVNADQPRL
jgi:adenylate cyclase